MADLLVAARRVSWASRPLDLSAMIRRDRTGFMRLGESMQTEAATGGLLAPAKQVRLGALTLPSRFLLAPLAGYTNLAFRLAVRELGGVGLATTDLVNARALLLRSRKTLELIQTCP